MRFVTQVVNGVCPDCSKATVLISIEHFFKCTRCGSELEQKVNGVISYIPSSHSGGYIPKMHGSTDGPQES